MRLLQEDYAFIELIQEEISEHTAIPLSIQPNRVMRIIKDSAKYFYEWHPQAIERKHFYIKKSDIDKARQDGMNASIQLSDAIKFIYKIRKSNSALGLSEASYLNNGVYGMGRFGGGMGGMNDAPMGSMGGRGQQNALGMALSMYEFQSIQSISSNNRGVAHSWSELTHRINFLSDVDMDIVLECGVEIPVSNMYGDRLFTQYVRGKCLESLAKIIGTYDFKLVGNTSINWADLKTDGKEYIDEVKEELKIFNSNNFIITQ